MYLATGQMGLEVFRADPSNPTQLDDISKFEVLFVSALEGEGLEDLRSLLGGRQMPRGRLGNHVVSTCLHVPSLLCVNVINIENRDNCKTHQD